MVSIFARLINCCWFCFKWGLLLGLVALAVAVPCFYHQVDERIRRQVVRRFAEHYADLQVTVRAAELVEGEGIKIRDLSIADPRGSGAEVELVHIGELFLHCHTDLQELVTDEPEITRITIRRPRLQTVCQADGTWTIERLLPLPEGCGGRPVPIVIENGTLELVDATRSPPGRFTLRDVHLTLTPEDVPGASPQDARPLRVQGSFEADHVRRVEIETALIDSKHQTWSVEGSVQGLDVSPELRHSLPHPWSEKLAVLGELRADGQLRFRVDYDPALASPCEFDVSGKLEHGRLDAACLPSPLTDVQATVRMDNQGIHVDEFLARSGEATFSASVHQFGYASGSPVVLEANAWQLDLDPCLLNVFPESRLEELRAGWDKYDPSGRVNLHLKLAFDGRTWRPELLMRCLDVSFCYRKFPYRLTHAVGDLYFKDDVFWTESLIARNGNRPVNVRWVVQRPMASTATWLEVWSREVPFDQRLMDALDEEAREVVASLGLRGSFDVYYRTNRDAPEQPWQTELAVELNEQNRCSLRYEGFPCPLGNVRGSLQMLNGHWTIRHLEASNDSAHVACEGFIRSPAEGGELFLRLTGTDVRLDEELRGAFVPSAQRVWDDLKPQGKVDLKEVVVRRLPGQDEPTVTVWAKPSGDSVSIEPASFPFRFEKLDCDLTYRDGLVTIERLNAEHGRVKMTATRGDCRFLPDGRWNLQLTGLSIDRLRLDDRELVRALPGHLNKAIAALQPTGPLHLRGSLALQGGAAEEDPVRSQWSLQIDMHQGGLECGAKLENICGGLTLAGGFDGEHFLSRGEFAVDSLTWNDFQFTQLMGPLLVDDRQVLLGSHVATRENQIAGSDGSRAPVQPRALTARLFGGYVGADAWVSLDSAPRYGIHATLARADLSRFAQEVLAGRQNLQGTIMATVDLGGTGSSIHAMGGHGHIYLRDAVIYELPVMFALLKRLRVQDPDTTAFNTSDIVFDIRGRHVTLSKIDFNGDAVSLLGRGEMDFDSNIALTFQPVLGRNQWRVPGFSELFRGASGQIMRISVDGTLQDPQTRKELFPAVNQAQRQLQGERPDGEASTGLLPLPARRSNSTGGGLFRW